MMNTIFALSMVAGVGLTTGTPAIGARVAEEMWAADSSGRKDLARTSYQTARRAVPAPTYLARRKTAAGERPAKKKPKGREYDRGDRREAIRMYLANDKVTDIAAAYGTHERTIYKWLRVSHFPSRFSSFHLALSVCTCSSRIEKSSASICGRCSELALFSCSLA